MRGELAAALGTVMADVRTAGAPEPRVEDREWAPRPDQASAMLRWGDGSGRGVSVLLGDPPAARLVWLADQLQEAVVERLWADGRPALWPECPAHPASHPLAARLLDGAATWTCPRDGHPVGPIGALAGDRPG